MLIGLCHSGDSIAQGSSANVSYFYQAFSWTPSADLDIIDSQANIVAVEPTMMYYSGNIIGRNMSVAGTRLNTNGFPDLVPLAPVLIDPIIPSPFSVPPFNIPRKYIFTTAIGSNDGAIRLTPRLLCMPLPLLRCCVAQRRRGMPLRGCVR